MQRLIILGYGIRGRTYAKYAEEHPDEFKVVAIADPDYGEFRTWEDALAESSGVEADAVVIALPDAMHRDAALKALTRGYHVLLEKPIGCNWRECEEIREAQLKAGKAVLTGYVLHFSAYYRKLREILVSGVIGSLSSIHHLVAISYGKSSHAFCRGNWSVEAEGTGLLVNKCTHDFDLIEWWTTGRKVAKISSFGSLKHWRPENRPEGAAERCSECPEAVRKECPFNAYHLYYDRKDLRYHFADESDAAILREIETSRYGRCVFSGGNDSADHQTVMMEYDDGLLVTLELESYSRERARITHFFGTRGEIIANEKTIEIRPFLGELSVVTPEAIEGHGGGDDGLMSAFHRLIVSGSPDRYRHVLDTALESHRLAFLAEESRYSGKTIKAN